MSSSNEPKRVIAWGRIFFVVIIVVILANFGKISSFFGSVFAPVIYDEIDPFSDMLVEVSGTEPFITLEYTDISGDPFLMENVKYEADKTSGLSNGDVVTITATASKRALKAAKKVFSRTTMQYTVEGQPIGLTPDTVLTDEQLQALRAGMDQMVETLFLDNGSHRDLQNAVQWHLFNSGIKYWLVASPTATLVSAEEPELVVMPVGYGTTIGNTYLLEPMTVHFEPNAENADDGPIDFTACLAIQFSAIVMDGNEITSWDISNIEFCDDLNTAILSLKKQDPTCKEITLPAAQ